MDVIQEVKKLGLPLGEYVVVGSGPMAVRNLRPTNDIDLVVIPRLYKKLKLSGWHEEHSPDPWREFGIFYRSFDAGIDWSINDFRPNPVELINDADIIDGVAFAKLQDVLAWKIAANRDKDTADIKLIRDYLAQK